MRPEFDLVLLLPRVSGLKELMRLLVLRASPSDMRESLETDRRRLLVSALLSSSFDDLPCFFRCGGDRDREGERLVETVDTESTDDLDMDRERLRLWLDLRPRSFSFAFKISSATPFLRNRSSGTSVVSFCLSLGFSSCCVREGREV